MAWAFLKFTTMYINAVSNILAKVVMEVLGYPSGK